MLKIATSIQNAKTLSSQFQKMKLRRIHKGIYTDDLKSDLEDIVLKNWMKILSNIVSQGILGYRTAVEFKPHVYDGKAIIFVISSYAKTVLD